MNIAEIEMQLSDLVSVPFDAEEFALDFIEIFNPPKATLTKLRKEADGRPIKDGEILWARKLYFRVAPSGEAASVLDELKAQKIAKNKAPRFLLSTDGEEFSALDVTVGAVCRSHALPLLVGQPASAVIVGTGGPRLPLPAV